MENWSKIEGAHERYAVSDFGRIWSANIGIMSMSLGTPGYARVNMIINGISRIYCVHQIVAKTFIPNPLGKPHVNHKKGIKTDNRATELEWCTVSENMIHKYEVLGYRNSSNPKRQKPIIAITVLTEDEQIFNGIRECAAFFKIPYQAIQRIIKGKRKTYKGLTFKIIPQCLLNEIEPLNNFTFPSDL